MWSAVAAVTMLPLPRLVLLGSVGLLMGAQSLWAVFPMPIEFTVWAIIALFLWAPLLARWSSERPVLGGFVVGLVAGLATGGVQAIFQATYLMHWPSYAAETAGMSPLLIGLGFLAFGLLAGALTGIVSGLAAWTIVAWKARRSPVVV